MKDDYFSAATDGKQMRLELPDVGSMIESRLAFSFDESWGCLAGYDQDCMIIASFGDLTHPSVVRRRRECSNNCPSESSPPSPVSPHGGLKDVEIVETRLRSDRFRKLGPVLVDLPGKERDKNVYLEAIERFLTRSKATGATLWYVGHGEKTTGNWCFRGNGFVSFEEIFDLYKRHFFGKPLLLVLDCPYAGNWGLTSIEMMDSLGIPACGHKAIEKGFLLKVFTSCGANQIPVEQWFSTHCVTCEDNEGGILFYAKDGDDQRPSCYNFTQFTCLRKAKDKCTAQSSWRWKDKFDRTLSSERVFLVRGKNGGRPAWHYVLLHEGKDNRVEFLRRIDKGQIDVAQFGFVLLSGWGEDPPDDVKRRAQHMF